MSFIAISAKYWSGFGQVIYWQGGIVVEHT